MPVQEIMRKQYLSLSARTLSARHTLLMTYRRCPTEGQVLPELHTATRYLYNWRQDRLLPYDTNPSRHAARRSQGAGAMDLYEIFHSNNASDLFTILFQWGNKSGQGNNPCLQEEVDHFTDAADILTTVFHTETQIGTKTMTHIVAVKNKGSTSQFMQTLFHSMGDGGFPRTRKPGKPQVHSLVII